MTAFEGIDVYDAAHVRRAIGALRAFNEARVLVAGDVHVALRLAQLVAEDDEHTLLAAALAVRAPRLGSVCVDLATIAATAVADVDDPANLQALPWPAPDAWINALASSPLVAVGEHTGAERPLRLVDTTLYLDRYWRDERFVAADLLARNNPSSDVDATVLSEGLTRLFDGEEPDLQLRTGRAVP